MLGVINQTVERALSRKWEADCIIMDPPDNLGLAYDGYIDKREDYYDWLQRIIADAMGRSPILWVSYYHHHDFEIKHRLHPIKDLWDVRTFVWTYTFGQNRDSDCGSGYRPLLRIARKGFPYDCESIKIPSWRSENGDHRAAPGGRVPLDVWDFPRVTGNSPERQAWHPTQHPEALYLRMLRMSGALRGGPFRAVDLFGGTGTLLRACKALRFRNPAISAFVIEQSAEYCKAIASQSSDFKITERVGLISGDDNPSL